MRCQIIFISGYRVQETMKKSIQLAEIGPVSHTMSRRFPLHQHMMDTFMESLGRGEIKNSNVRIVTTREIYKSRMSSLLTPPKVEAKFPLVKFSVLVYPRLKNAVLETRQRDVMFTVIHGLYKNRDRLYRQNRVDSPLCANQACRNLHLAETIEHKFCTCFRVKAAWLWVRQKVTELLSDQGLVAAATNLEILMLMYARCMQETEVVFLLGTFMELVDIEVGGKQKELLLDTVKGVVRAKLGHLPSRSVPQVSLPLTWF